MGHILQISPQDNVAVALKPIVAGGEVSCAAHSFIVKQTIQQGHKIALAALDKGQPVVKYGYSIGVATQPVLPGEWVHTHNMKTILSEEDRYSYHPVQHVLPTVSSASFEGYLRPDGRAGVRNELWILPTVGCVNDVCARLAKNSASLSEAYGLDGVYAFPHPYGCSQMGKDHEHTRKVLAALARHPNAGGVLVVGLGCENLTMEQFCNQLGSFDDAHIKFMVCQQEADELKTGAALLSQLAAHAAVFKRQTLSADKLIVGLKCGGSDGLSGITANPLAGAFSDRLIAMGGSSILTEVPEMFGAEEMLLERCVSRDVFEQAVKMVTAFKHYFTEHGQVVYENPSPGNKQGGITTLEDKSLGCVQKGGFAPVTGVIEYGGQVRTRGLTLLSGPGNDLVSTTALSAAGAQIILFTTGRGTPFGAPVPTLKIASNTALAMGKANWVDFNAGTIADESPLQAEAEKLMDLVLATASGKQTKSEENGYRSIAIFKSGVTL